MKSRLHRGSMLVAVLVMLVFLQIVAASVVLSGGRESSLAADRLASSRAFYNAEAAASMAIREVATSTDADGDGKIGGISDDGNAATGYTLNGGKINAAATIVSNTTTVTPSGTALVSSRARSLTIRKTPSGPGHVGLLAEVWKVNGWVTIASTNYTLPKLAVGWVPDPYIAGLDNNTNKWYVGQPTDGYSVRFSGKINIPTAGAWTFGTTSDDGSTMWIDGTQVVANDYGQSPTFRSGSAITLTQGWHDIVIYFTDGGGWHQLICHWLAPGSGTWEKIPPQNFCFYPTTRPYPFVTENFSYHQSNSYGGPQVVDAWDSSQGVYSSGLAITGLDLVATNGTANGCLTVTGECQVRGNGASGVGSDTYYTFNVHSAGVLTGTRSALTTKRIVPIMDPKPNMPAATAAINLVNTNQTVTTDLTIPQLYLSGTSILTISGDVTINVTSDMQLANTAQIVVNTGSILRLYVGTASAIQNTAKINPSGDPNRCWMFFKNSITLYNDVRLCGHIYVPYSALATQLTCEIAGTYHGMQYYGYNWCIFHGDVGPSGTGGSGGTTILSWN